MNKIILVLFVCLLSHTSYAQNKFIVSKINIIGNNITKESVILRELEFNVGDTVSSDEIEKKINNSLHNLYNIELFNFIDIDKILFNKNIEINILVTEQWYIWPYPILEISERNFNTWWKDFSSSNYSDFSRLNYGIHLTWRNFRGKNEQLEFKYRIGFKEQYLIFYNNPFINKKKTIGFQAYVQAFRRKKTFYKTTNNLLDYYTSENNFSSIDFEINSEIILRKNINTKHSINASYFESKIDSNIANLNSNYLNNNLTTGSYYKLSYEIEHEKRDYIVYPLSGHYLNFELGKQFPVKAPVSNFEITLHIEKHIKLKPRTFFGSSLKTKWTSSNYQPYFSQVGLGFEDYIRSYEYYVIDGQKFFVSKNVLKYAVINKTKFDIPYLKSKQFNKSHYSIYLGLFSDLGYVVDKQTANSNHLSNSFLWGNGISVDYITYYDKLLRIEFSINHLGEKGVFLHFSNPFGDKNKL